MTNIKFKLNINALFELGLGSECYFVSPSSATSMHIVICMQLVTACFTKQDFGYGLNKWNHSPNPNH